MILGIGSDIVDIRRVEKLMSRYERRFIVRCFTEEERKIAERRRSAGTHIAAYAKRFAAKEACAKALGNGFGRGVSLRDIGVVNSANAAPLLKLTGGAATCLAALTPAGMRTQIHLSLSDEIPLAQAFVVIEALPL